MTDPAKPAVMPRLVLSVLLACATLTVMAGATIAPSLPGLLAHFDGVPNAVTLVPLILTVPGLAIALSAPLFGLLVDRVDPRRVLVVSIMLYIAAGSTGLYLDDLGPIIAGRIVLGLAVGGLMTASTTLLANLFAGPERGRVLGYQASAMSFGGVLFILGGGLLADIGWRGPFAMYLVPLLLLPLVLRIVPAPQTGGGHDDTAVTARFPVLFAGLIYASTFASFLIFYMIPTQLPFLIASLGAQKASTAGYVISLMTLGSAVMSLQFGRLRGRLSPLTIGALGFGALGLGFIAISQVTAVAPLFFIAPFIGVALGVMMPNHTNWLFSRIPAPMRGRASGFMTMAVFSAQFVSAFVGAALVQAGGLSMVFGAMAVVALAVAAIHAALLALRPGSARAPA